MRILQIIFCVGGVALLCAACLPSPSTADPDRLQGRILLWHTWGELETEALQGVIDRFGAIHPGVNVRHQRFATLTEMLEEFELEKHKVEIPYSQRDIHIRTVTPSANGGSDGQPVLTLDSAEKHAPKLPG